MWRIKMFFKFIYWLLMKRILVVPLKLVQLLTYFFQEWRDECRTDYGNAALLWLLTATFSMIFGLVGVFIFSPDLTKEQLLSAVIYGLLTSCGMLFFVIMLAAYDSFIEEYEQTFTKLKE